MATSLLVLLDDIASVLDDVSTLTGVAARKTSGVLGDDLALNAQQVTGVNADRELPVVWAVAKGSLRNKAILVPAALAISAFVPAAVTPLLMAGGAYLCFEGFEKIFHKALTRHGPRQAQPASPAAVVETEAEKIQGAVRTDFILSAEIITITLGTVAGQTLLTRSLVLAGVALLMTVGVYGLVAGIVKLDDAGLWLSRRASALQRQIGRGIVRSAPWLMKGLAWAGTAAMFLVGGGILGHGIPAWHHAVEAQVAQAVAAGASGASGLPGVLAAVLPTSLPLLADGVLGVTAGAVLLGLFSAFQRLRGGLASH